MTAFDWAGGFLMRLRCARWHGCRSLKVTVQAFWMAPLFLLNGDMEIDQRRWHRLCDRTRGWKTDRK